MKSNKPKVRFKNYDDAWEQRKLGDVAKFSKGRGYSKNDLVKEGTPIILYGSLYTNYQTVIKEVNTFVEDKDNSVYSLGNEVIVPSSGESAEDIARASVVVNKGIILGGDLNIIHSNNDIDPTFLALLISNGERKIDLAKKAQGKSVVHLYNTDLQELYLMYPSRKEQEKISNFFNNLDNLIALHQRKLETTKELKKTMLRKMFPQKDETTPEIRFKGFTDPWEQRKLGEVIEDYIEKTTIQNQYPVLTSSQQQGIILQEDYFANRQVTTDNNIGYFVLPKGYFTYRSRSDTDVFVFNRNNLIDKGIVSYFYPVFCAKNTNSDFLLRRINFGMQRQVAMAAEGTGQKVLSLKKFKEITTKFPELEEQKKIGMLFESLDNLITLHQRKLESLERQKQYFLKTMFI